jgi:hypothetical protein
MAIQVHRPTPADPSRSDGNQPDDFQLAVQAATRAIRAINAGERTGDGAEFIAHLAAAVAANLGSSYTLTQARSGSWEAAKVLDLVHSTAGYDDEYLLMYRTEPVEIVVNAEFELNELGLWKTYPASIEHIGQQLFGDRYKLTRTETHPVWGTREIQRGHLTADELERMEQIDELLWNLEEADQTDYQTRFTETVTAEYQRLRSEDPNVYPPSVTVTVRFTDDLDDLTDPWDGLAGRLYAHARANTPMPGSNTPPDHTVGEQYADRLLAAGLWPHLRVPELAHHSVPITHDTTNEVEP